VLAAAERQNYRQALEKGNAEEVKKWKQKMKRNTQGTQ
jgi:hypothetical protein